MLGFAVGRSFGSHFKRIVPNFKNVTRQMSKKLFFNEMEGDVLGAPNNYSLVTCVAADMNMSSGIAYKFSRAFNQVAELRSQKPKAGGVAVLENDDRYIYYLIFKGNSADTPTYDTLRSSLHAMKQHMVRRKVDKLAMPRIGCEDGGLHWDEVKAEIYKVFGSDDICITVYHTSKRE